MGKHTFSFRHRLENVSTSLILRSISTVSFLLGAVLAIMGTILALLDFSMALNVFKVTAEQAAFVVNQFPGIPILVTDVADQGFLTVGLVTSILGVDLLLVGAGLRAGIRIAKWTAIMLFSLAVYFDFVEFLVLGLLGAPMSLAMAVLNAVILYLLLKLKI